MNVVLWIVQVLLALHTATGAAWKLSTSEVDAGLAGLPHALWLGLVPLELLSVAGLLLPIFGRRFGKAPVVAALVIVGEMLLFTGVHLAGGEAQQAQIVYWLVVAGICGLLVAGRQYLRPIRPA